MKSNEELKNLLSELREAESVASNAYEEYKSCEIVSKSKYKKLYNALLDNVKESHKKVEYHGYKGVFFVTLLEIESYFSANVQYKNEVLKGIPWMNLYVDGDCLSDIFSRMLKGL